MMLNAYYAEKIARDKMKEAHRQAENDRISAGARTEWRGRMRVRATGAIIAVASLAAAAVIVL